MDGVHATIGENTEVLRRARQGMPIVDELRDVPPLMAQLKEVIETLAEIRNMLAAPKATREWYSVEEAAKILGKSTYTVREYCREGRVNARKRAERRGGSELWNISADEVTRVQDEGLLPADFGRNSGR